MVSALTPRTHCEDCYMPYELFVCLCGAGSVHSAFSLSVSKHLELSLIPANFLLIILMRACCKFLRPAERIASMT